MNIRLHSQENLVNERLYEDSGQLADFLINSVINTENNGSPIIQCDSAYIYNECTRNHIDKYRESNCNVAETNNIVDLEKSTFCDPDDCSGPVAASSPFSTILLKPLTHVQNFDDNKGLLPSPVVQEKQNHLEISCGYNESFLSAVDTNYPNVNSKECSMSDPEVRSVDNLEIDLIKESSRISEKLQDSTVLFNYSNFSNDRSCRTFICCILSNSFNQLSSEGDRESSEEIDITHKEKLTRHLIESNFDVGFIDTHCHIDFLFRKVKFNRSFKSYKKKCEQSEHPFPRAYEGCVAVFCNPSSFHKVKWWESLLNDDEVWGAFGCHPHFADQFGEEEEQHLRHALKHKKVKALGEIGLDFSRKKYEVKELQERVFRRQLQIAIELQKPLVIHTRDSSALCLSILKEVVPKDYIIHRHCFTGDSEEAVKWLSYFSNLYIGLTCLVTQDTVRANRVKEAIQKIPLERLLLETDAPYFRPSYLPGPERHSHPGMAIHVAAEVASVKNTEIRHVLYHARYNTKAFYSI